MSGYEPQNPAYLARLIDATCARCGAACRFDRIGIAHGKVPHCRPCSYATRSKKRAQGRAGEKHTCAVCQVSFERAPARAARAVTLTCSAACRDEARSRGLIVRTAPPPRGEAHKQWEGGRAGINYGANWKSQRDAAVARDLHACQHCGISERDHGRALEVHHIVRFVDFADYRQANDLSNLITLCVTCHRKADAALYHARRAAGVRRVWHKERRQERRQRWDTLAALVCILARNWQVVSTSETVEGEEPYKIAQALANSQTRPAKSRGLCDAPDLCQATTLLRANAEIEADCWRFYLDDESAWDKRRFIDLLGSGENRRITRALRVAFLDWANPNDGNGAPWCDRRASAEAGSRGWDNARGVGQRLPDALKRAWPQDAI